MSCCSAKTMEDKLEPYELRALYIKQIQRLARKGIFGQAVYVFKEVRFVCCFCISVMKTLNL